MGEPFPPGDARKDGDDLPGQLGFGRVGERGQESRMRRPGRFDESQDLVPGFAVRGEVEELRRQAERGRAEQPEEPEQGFPVQVLFPVEERLDGLDRLRADRPLEEGVEKSGFFRDPLPGGGRARGSSG